MDFQFDELAILNYSKLQMILIKLSELKVNAGTIDE